MFKSDFFIYSTWRKEGSSFLNDLLYLCVRHYYSFIMPEKCQKFKHRSYSSIHAFSWAISLERYGYTNCMFRDCHFMALDLDVMALHHYECPGGGNNESLFMCAVCKRGTSDQVTLNNHYFLAHPEEARTRGISTVTFTQTMPKILSNVRKKSWEIFLERKGYIKCLIQNCQFITDEVNVMKEHYYYCSKGLPNGNMSNTCPTCCGVTNNKEFFERHCSKCNKLAEQSTDYFAPQPKVTLEMIHMWTENIRKYKAAKCSRSGCRFIDNNVMALKTHFVKCKTIPNPVQIVCHICGGWLSNAKKLEEHLQSVHKPHETMPNLVLVLQENDNENNFMYEMLSRTQFLENGDESCSLHTCYEEDSENQQTFKIELKVSEEEKEKNEESQTGNNRSIPNRRIFKTYQKTSHKKTVHPSIEVLIPGKTRKIDYVKTKQLSCIQYGRNFVEKNTELLSEVNVRDDRRRRRCCEQQLDYDFTSEDIQKMEGTYFSPFNFGSNQPVNPTHRVHFNLKANHMRIEPKKKIPDLTPLAKIANKLMKENKELPVPVNISVEDKSWTVSVSPSVVGGPKLTGNIINDFNSVGQYMRREANILLRCARTKNTVYNKQTYQKRYPTRFKEQSVLPKLDFFPRLEQDSVFDTKPDDLYDEVDIIRNSKIKGKSYANIGIISHCNMVNFKNKNPAPANAVRMQTYSRNEKENHHKVNRNKQQLIEVSQTTGKTTKPPSISRNANLENNDCTIEQNCNQDESVSLETIAEDTETEDDVCIISDNDICTNDKGQHKVIANNRKSKNKGVINVKGRPLIFDDQELEIILLNPNNIETSSVNAKYNDLQKSSMEESANIPKNDLEIMVDRGQTSGEEENSQDESNIVGISNNSDVIDKEIMKSFGSNANEVLTSEVSIMPLNTKNDLLKNDAKNISAISVKENSISAPASKVKDDQKNVTMTTTDHAVSLDISTENDLIEQKVSSAQSDVDTLCTKDPDTDLSEGEDLSINKNITDVQNEESFTDISSKIEIDSKESTDRPETLDIFSSSSISMGLLRNLNGKPKNNKSSLSDSGQEFCNSKRVGINKFNYKKGDLKKRKVKGKNDCFLGFAENSSSCNKLNHLLSYCNILGITAELQTYPIHVKFDVTPNKPGNSANNVDGKGNNNKSKESDSSEENNKNQQKSEDTITTSPDDNPSNSSKKRKFEKKTGKAQKPGDQNTKNTGDNSDKLVGEYNSFVGTLGKTSTPFVKRNEKKSSNTDVDTTVEPNVRDQTEESSSMSTTISRNDSVEQNETDVSCAESEKTLKKDETSSRTQAKDDNNELGNSPVSKPTSVIHGEQTSKEDDTDETNKMNKKDNNDKNKDQSTRRRRNEKPGESKQDANESNDSSEDGPAKKKGRLESNEQKLINETLPKEKDTSESRKSILSEYLMSRNHSTSGEVQSLTKRKRGRPRKTHIPNIVEEQSNLPAKNPSISEKKNSDQAVSKPEESLDNGRVSSASKSQKENISESHQDTIDISISGLKSESNFSETDLKNESNTSQEEYTSAHLPPSPPPVKRKPGRPRKNPLPTRIFETGLLDSSGPSAPGDMDFNDLNDSGNKRAFGRPRRPSLSRQPAASADTIENLDSVGSCAICKESMTIRDFQKKHFQIHNFMCWMDGDEPLDLECENTIVNWLIRWKKKFPKHLFKCEKCGETKKSVKGFLSHIQFCGKTLEERQRLMVACPICGRVMMPSSLEQHRPLCSKKVPPPKESLGEIALSTRKAARQCLETIADLAPNLLDDGKSKKRRRNDPNIENLEVDSDEDMLEAIGDSTSQKRDEVKELYTLKTKRSTKHLRTIWELAVADGKVLHCPCPSCEFSSLTFNEMNDHYRTCEYDFQGYICKDCRYTSNSEKDMVKHVKTIHSDHLQLIKEGERVAPVRREEYGTGSIYIPFLRKAELSFSGSAKISKFFRPALGWTQQQRTLNYTTESIFPEYKFVPELWQELNFNSIEPYLPEKKQSVKFCCKNSSNWAQLKLFESRVLNENMCIMFTGGPVWGLAWAPGSTDIQYLAVSTHLSMHSNFRMGSVHTGPGVVQIWSLKNINNFSNLSDEQVKLEYVFCHDYGGCWALEWCPAGCQDNARIGLLAIATTSGIIPLFAVPTPQVLNAALHSEQAKHYKPEPALLLKLSPFVNSQCTRLSWSKVKPHRSLVAGFTNGIIGVWDLNSQSVLLKSGITLYPYKTFNAHHSNITGLCLSPASETYLVSSALDKTVKFWDLNDTTAPHSIHRRGLVNDVAWMQHWLCAVAVYDESYMTSQTTVALHSVRDYIFQPGSFISNVKSSAWCVSVSDWLNAIAISYDNGQITVAFAKQQDPTNEKRDEKKKLVKVVLETSLFDFDKNMPLSSNNESIEEAASANAQNSSLAGSTSSVSEKPSTSSVDQYEPRTVDCCTFEEVSEKYGVQFDCDINFKRETFLKGNQANPIDIYPIMSANKVTWNPNRHALLSMAVGYQSGFVVIPKLTLPLFDEKFVESFLKSSKGNVEI